MFEILDKKIIDKELKDIICVYTTCGSKEEAELIGLSAIKEKLAVSVDYWPVNSIYPWKGVIKNINQYMLMFSTQRMLSQKLIRHIEIKHSYTVPMITMCDLSATNQQYSFWAESTLINRAEYLTELEAKIKDELEEKSKEYNYAKLK